MQHSSRNDYYLKPDKIKQAFNAAAENYDAFSVLQQTITDRLIESFEYINIKPVSILDLGSGTGYGSGRLNRRFNKAQVYQLDISEKMLRKSRQKAPRFFSRDHFVSADAGRVPFADASFELVFSSLMLQWCNDLDRVFSEVRRVLKKGGVFVFASFGPDTLKELRESWRQADDGVHVNIFVDIHDLGDALIHNGLDGPVLTAEHIVLTYDDCRQLMTELKNIGANNINAGRRKTLTGKKRFQSMTKSYETHRKDQKLPATYELILGHAWQADKAAATNISSGLHYVPVEDVKTRRPGNS